MYSRRAEPTAAPIEVPYSWSSTVTPEACIPLATLGCVRVQPADGWFDMPKFDGTPTHTSITLSWTAEPGGLPEIHFALVRANACEGEGCWSGEAVSSVEGVSPLALETDIPALSDGEFLVVVVRPMSTFPEPIYGYAHAEQSFSAEGKTTVQP